MTESQPLEGLHVLDLTWIVAGPTVARALADFGATVIHVETSRRPDTARLVGPFHDGVPGVERSILYGNVNAGKLGLALDLSNEAARDVVRDLVGWADVMAESFSPGVMARWGLGYEQVRQLKPDLVMLSSCLMGQSGPYAQFAGYGNSGASMSGFQYLAGWPDRPPLGPFGPYTDYVGPRLSVVALLAALDHRRRTGEGCYIDVAQAEAGMHFLAPAFVDYFATGRVAERAGNRDLQLAPHGVYPCRPTDGRDRSWVAIAVRSDDEWSRLALLIGGDDLAADARFATVDRRQEAEDLLDGVLAAWTAPRGAAEVEAELQQLGISAHVAQTSADALADPQLQHRGHFVELDHPLHGKTVVEAPRYKLSRTPAAIARAAPAYGQDNHYVLHEILGYDEQRIAALSASGALA